MIVLSDEVPVVPLIRSWSGAGWLARLCGDTDEERTADAERNGRDGHRRLMTLCPRCLSERHAQRVEMVGAAA